MDHVILNHDQVTWTTPEFSPSLLTTTPHQREDVSALDRFNVHRCPTRRVFSGTGPELVTRQATIRYLYHSATAALKVSKSYGLLRNYPPKCNKRIRGRYVVSSSLVPLKFHLTEKANAS
ncbi:uncharacterized protein TNCV_1404811 [Trichonephila clavipes]|nr:uncharacterized protein TNCV_1404811 [Trichonephila clavipes]